MMRKTFLAGAGGVGAAILGSLCCVAPLLVVTLGVGAGLASTFEPLRPVFGFIMLGLFAVAFYSVYAERDESTANDPTCSTSCAAPRNLRREKLLIWTAALIAFAVWMFPAWSVWLI